MRALPDHFSEFFRFCCVGGIGFLVDYGLLELFVAEGASASVARVLSISITLQLMYLLHRRFTYRTQTQRGLRPWLRFLVTNLLGALINYLVFLCTLSLLTFPTETMNRLLAVVAGTGVALFFNHFMNRRFTFAPEKHP